MKKKQGRKLMLSRETLRRLETASLEKVAGGAVKPSVTCTEEPTLQEVCETFGCTETWHCASIVTC